MHRGLNIGIGSWIDAQQGSDALPALPINPIPFRLSHLSDLETPEDLARATELSLLCNRQGEPGGTYSLGDIPSYLWEVHVENIRRMVTAVAPLTGEQRRQLDHANGVLYQEDGFTMSEQYILFQETRQAYQELVAQGASPEEVQAAYEAWVVAGNKGIVEEAIATKLSLTRASSRLLAQGDLGKIELALMSLGADIPNAPTLFTPISAVSTEYWTEAEVDFQALEDAIRPGAPSGAWKEFRSNKLGTVRFRFVSVELVRSWFTAAIYAADDWKLANGGLVASGNGQEGNLPCYYSRLHLAQVLDVRSRPASRPRPQATLPLVRPGMSQAILAARLPNRSLGHRSGPTTRISPRLAKPAPARPGTVRAQTIGSRSNADPLPIAARVSSLAVRPASLGVSHVALKPHLTLGSEGRIARIQKLSPILAANRLTFVQGVLVAPSTKPEPSPTEPSTFIVGFGRTYLPRSPDPNPNYQWP